MARKQEEKESMSYEKMFERVETIVDTISSKDSMNLDQVVSSIEEGYRLIEAMRERLKQAKDKVEMIKKLNILDDEDREDANDDDDNNDEKMGEEDEEEEDDDDGKAPF